MSLPAPGYNNDFNQQTHFLAWPQILAPVPRQRNQPLPGYVGFTSRIDGTIARGTNYCSCSNSFGPAYGVEDQNITLDPRLPYYANLNTNLPGNCVDANAISYNVNAAQGNNNACVYSNPNAFQDCLSARNGTSGCRHVPGKHSI